MAEKRVRQLELLTSYLLPFRSLQTCLQIVQCIGVMPSWVLDSAERASEDAQKGQTNWSTFMTKIG